MSEGRPQRNAAEVEQSRQLSVDRGVEVEDEHLMTALSYGCGPDDDAVVRAMVDAAEGQREADDWIEIAQDADTGEWNYRVIRGRRLAAFKKGFPTREAAVLAAAGQQEGSGVRTKVVRS